MGKSVGLFDFEDGDFHLAAGGFEGDGVAGFAADDGNAHWGFIGDAPFAGVGFAGADHLILLFGLIPFFNRHPIADIDGILLAVFIFDDLGIAEDLAQKSGG